MAELGVTLGGVNSQVVDAVTGANFKTLAEAATVNYLQLQSAISQSYAAGIQNQVSAQNLALQNATSSQARINSVAEAAMAKLIDNLSSVDPIEAVSTARLFKGDADSSIASLLAQQTAGQMGVKLAQSTPGDLAGDVARLSAAFAGQSAQLGTVIALVQQIMKGAQSTPPETAIPPVAK